MVTARVVYRSATSVWQKRWGGDLSDGEEGDGEGIQIKNRYIIVEIIKHLW